MPGDDLLAFHSAFVDNDHFSCFDIPDKFGANRFKPTSKGVWEWKLDQPQENLSAAKLDVSVKDKQGNTSRLVRSFSVTKEAK